MRSPRLPESPVAYHQLLRGPTRRWWRPLVALLVLAGFVIVGTIVVELIAIGFKVARGQDPFADPTADLASATTFLELNLILGATLPAAVFSIWVVHRIRPGFVSSVAGRIRWPWLGRSLLIIVPIWMAYITTNVLIGLATGTPITARPAEWLTLLILVLLTTPLQAAAEEYVFRGWLTQNLGMYFASERVGLVVTTIVSSVLFALAHGSFDPWILGDLLAFAIAASLMTWRTGGLEAAIALHVVNNVLNFGVVLAFGGWEDAFVDTASSGSPISFALSLVFNVLVVTLVWRATGRQGLVRTGPPSAHRPCPSP